MYNIKYLDINGKIYVIHFVHNTDICICNFKKKIDDGRNNGRNDDSNVITTERIDVHRWADE